MREAVDPIGGYFPLELQPGAGSIYPTAHRFQSARAGLVALLRSVHARRLWLPRLICDAVPSAAANAKVKVQYYALDPHDGTPLDVDLSRGDVLLHVNLFGVMGAASRAVLRRFAPEQVVLDHAHAFFEPPGRCLATVYSPRKFFGLPDGGLLISKRPLAPPADQDRGSIERCRHLLKRLAFSPEEGYADFKAAEAELDDCEPRAMSTLTKALMDSLDITEVGRRRTKNFSALQDRFGPSNNWPFPLPATPALCYPFLRDERRDDARMRKNRLFLATYWPEAQKRCPTASLEGQILSHMVPIPVDQRYVVGPAFFARLRKAGIAR